MTAVADGAGTAGETEDAISNLQGSRQRREHVFPKGIGWMLLVGAWIAPLGLCSSAAACEELPPITAPPQTLSAGPFYKQYLDCGGIPILSSEKVAGAALHKAGDLIGRMLADRPDVRRVLADAGVRFVIIGAKEQTTDIPEYSHMRPKEYVNERSRGFGGRVTSCGEENLLCYAIDRYDDENILIHEFAHVIHGSGLRRVDKEFDKELRRLYQKAVAKGLWKNTYAGSNPGEYWAEAVQSYYDANRQNNWNHNHVNTREELEAYDPDLAKLVADTFRHTESSDWRYQPVAKQPQVTSPPERLKCDPFFKKYVWARGFPVLGSEKVSDAALLEANYLIRQMFAYRHDVLKAMIDAGVRLVVIGDREEPNQIPGYAELDMAQYLETADRGALRLPKSLTMACREGNLLNRRGDRCAAENMLVRQFAGALYAVTGFRPVDEEFLKRPKQQYELRLARIDESFDRKLRDLYNQAIQKGLWKNTRAAVNRAEYWADGVQSWFDCNRESAEPDGVHNHVNTREELEAYDPDLAGFIAEVFRHKHRLDWRYRRPADGRPE